MNTPLILLCGQAGSGKDTVAEMLVRNHGAAAIAQADPMKRLGYHVFKFTEAQLWGPSELRNTVDTRFSNKDDIYHYLFLLANNKFVESLFPDYSVTDIKEARLSLDSWAKNLLHDAVKEGGLSPRKMLQTLGTEWGRNLNKDMWASYANRTALKLLGGGYRYSRSSGLIEDATSMPNVVVITDGRFRNEIVSVTSVGGEAWKIVNPVVGESPGIKGHASEDEQKSIPNHFFNCIIRNDRRDGLDKLKVLVDWVYEERVAYRHPYPNSYGLTDDGRVITWPLPGAYEVALNSHKQRMEMHRSSK